MLQSRVAQTGRCAEPDDKRTGRGGSEIASRLAGVMIPARMAVCRVHIDPWALCRQGIWKQRCCNMPFLMPGSEELGSFSDLMYGVWQPIFKPYARRYSWWAGEFGEFLPYSAAARPSNAELPALCCVRHAAATIASIWPRSVSLSLHLCQSGTVCSFRGPASLRQQPPHRSIACRCWPAVSPAYARIRVVAVSEPSAARCHANADLNP